MRLIRCICLLGVMGSWARADVVTLKNGSTVEGKVRRDGDGWVVKNNNGHVTQLAGDQVESIELIPATNPSPAAAQVRLTSLRHSLENLSDLKEIIFRVQRFVDQGEANSPTTLEAKKDLAIWKDRLSQQMVKVGSAWVLPAERDRLVDHAQESIEAARQLMKQGRTKEAEPLLADALNVDPQNASGLFLVGLIKAQQDQLPEARRAFEVVKNLVPNHGPTLNNLAIIRWRQNQYSGSLSSFDDAMLAMPVDPTVLENVGGALSSLPVDLQNSTVAQRVAWHFEQQDRLLVDRMAKQGLHRFGSHWLNDAQLSQAQAQERRIVDRLGQLSGDFDQTTHVVNQLDQSISDGQTRIRLLGLNDYTFGLAISVAKLQSERSDSVNKLDAIKKQADDLEASRPSIKNGGVQIMFGPEAVPLRLLIPAIK